MKRRSKKNKGVVKGAPSGFLLSVLIHAAAFMLAGLLVVFNVVQKEEKKFVPPKPVDRPKMKLKKPKVKVKKSAKPRSSTRIVTKVKRASMPDIQLPEMSGLGEGLAGGIGGFEIMPDLSEVTMFGSGQSIGNDFVGTFYDMKRNRSGKPIPHDRDTFKQDVKQFIIKGWRPSAWAKFYRSPRKLYTTTFAVPPVQSALAPQAFGEHDTIGYTWIAHYKGQLVYHEDITFRFWGMGDDLLAVRVDGKEVLLAPWPSHEAPFTSIWSSSSADNRKYVLGNNLSVVGDWITLKAGEPLDMEVLSSEITGGVFCSLLCVEVEGVEYPKNPLGHGPTLPIFKTEEPSLDLAEQIWADLDPGDASVTNGPVFRDYLSKGGELKEAEVVPIAAPIEEEDPMRLWTNRDGKTLEGEFVTVIGKDAVLKTPKGRQKKVPLAQLTDEDINYIELAMPPKLALDFSKKSNQKPLPEQSPYISNQRPLQIFGYTFGVKVKKTSSGAYNHPLKIEYFAIGEEVDGDNWVLLERGSSTFTPTKENKGLHEFYGEEVVLQVQAIRDAAPLRGTKYGGFLIIVTDERGKIIQYSASHEFLNDVRENLNRLPVGKHFNKEGKRVPPPRPGKGDRPSWV
ncbi:hypothetical protein P4B35_15755 [Pontiellaceae bacterium B12227]|nr:hypothetical protein [Pontiellaceae bacterium B12227]